MYVVTLVTQKGGSDKSTFTVGLAVAAMEDANGVAVIRKGLRGKSRVVGLVRKQLNREAVVHG